MAIEPKEDELKAVYEKEKSTFSQPATIHAANIFLAAPAEDAAARARRRTEAESLLKEVLKKSATDFYAFSTIAHAKSEDAATRGAGGELPWLTSAQLDARLGAGTSERLGTTPGKVPAVMVESGTGFNLVRLLDVRAAAEAPFAQVRENLAQRLRSEKKAVAWKDFLSRVETATAFRVDDEAVKNMKLP